VKIRFQYQPFERLGNSNLFVNILSISEYFMKILFIGKQHDAAT